MTDHTAADWAPGATISVISRTGCHLCEDVEGVVAGVAADLGVTWERVDVDEHPALRADYSDLVPVTMVAGRYLEHWRVDERRLRRAVAAATSTEPAAARATPGPGTTRGRATRWGWLRSRSRRRRD